jgi:hypothetical protein
MSPRLGEDLKSDPFSLRGVDSRRLAEAVSRHSLRSTDEQY